MQVTVAGNGRLGKQIQSALQQRGHSIQLARVDPVQGLIINAAPVFGQLDTLVICFVPQQSERGAGWRTALKGFQQQVSRGDLEIGQLLFISSTSVYESVETGLVDANTPVQPVSTRSGGLLSAEAIVPTLSPCTTIFRLTGLVGPGYDKYDPVSYSIDKPRQAVDIRAVANATADRLSSPQSGHHLEVLTDGLIYWQQRPFRAADEEELMAHLLGQYRLLQPSIICPSPV